MTMGGKSLPFPVLCFESLLRSPLFLGVFFPSCGEDGEPSNGEDERCNKNDMNPVYFNHLACMCVLCDTFSYHLQKIILRLFCCFIM